MLRIFTIKSKELAERIANDDSGCDRCPDNTASFWVECVDESTSRLVAGPEIVCTVCLSIWLDRLASYVRDSFGDEAL